MRLEKESFLERVKALPIRCSFKKTLEVIF